MLASLYSRKVFIVASECEGKQLEKITNRSVGKSETRCVCARMGGPTVVPGYSRAYPIFLRKILVVLGGIYMYNIVNVSNLRFFTIFSL